jgi:hypothetical protein
MVYPSRRLQARGLGETAEGAAGQTVQQKLKIAKKRRFLVASFKSIPAQEIFDVP